MDEDLTFKRLELLEPIGNLPKGAICNCMIDGFFGEEYMFTLSFEKYGWANFGDKEYKNKFKVLND